MNTVAIKGIFGRKLRTFLTALAIVLGVAMISGTYILTDTITAAFTNVVDDSYSNSDAVVSGKVAFKNANSNTEETPAFPATVLADVKQLPDVSAAAGSISDELKLIDRNGKVIATGGGEAIASSVDPANDRQFNPLKLVSGQWPVGNGQIAIDQRTADKEHFAVGDNIGAAADDGVQQFEIAGIAKFASSSSIGASTIAIFDVPTAQELFNKVGKYDEVQISAKTGVTPDKLVGEIRPLLPQTAEVQTSAAKTDDAVDDVNSAMGIFQKILLAFGVIALFVGAFVIANTLSITIAQRMREFATLRTLGASRRQVLRTVMIEALAVGLLASVIGLFLGLGIAKGLNALFGAVGVNFPAGGTVFAARTIVVSIVIGVVVTLLASLRPAIKATRVPPIAAVREGASSAALEGVSLRSDLLAGDTGPGDSPACLRDLRERSHDRDPAARSRLRDPDPLRRCLAEREASGPSTRVGSGLARDADRRHRRPARPRERDEKPEPDGIDGIGADDRPGLDHVRGHSRSRTADVVRRCCRQAVHRGLCADGRERVRPVHEGGRRRRGGDAGRDRGFTRQGRRRPDLRGQRPGHCGQAEPGRDHAARLAAGRQ